MKTIDSNGYDFKKSSLVYPDFQKMKINVDKPYSWLILSQIYYWRLKFYVGMATNYQLEKSRRDDDRVYVTTMEHKDLLRNLCDNQL